MDAIYSFCRAGMPLTSLFFKMDRYEGRTFDLLSPFEKSKILNTKIVIHVLNPGLTPQERFGIYICLKPRIDSATLKWCRSRIYTEQYELIENLAKRIKESLPLMFNRTESLENRICHLIVGIQYELFLNLSKNLHIDAAVNSILGLSDFPTQIEALFEGIEETLKVTCQLSSRELAVQYQSLYDSVFYHMRNSDSVGLLQDDFRQLLKDIRYYQMKGSKDSTKNFCNKIHIILNNIYDYSNNS